MFKADKSWFSDLRFLQSSLLQSTSFLHARRGYKPRQTNLFGF